MNVRQRSFVAVIMLIAPLVSVHPTSASAADAPTGSWTAAQSMSVPRGSLSATPLASGRVLIVGGSDEITTELYDPPTGGWIPGGTLSVARGLHVAVRLADGRVLVAGGAEYTATAELYDPATNRWTSTGNMHVDRLDATGTLLRDGRVLVVGGLALTAPVSRRAPSCMTRRPATGASPAASGRPGGTTRRRCCPTARSWSREAPTRATGCGALSSTTPLAGAGRGLRR
jgi:hypothetical protein